MTRIPAIPRIVLLLCWCLAAPHPARAHLGPPFPILVDQPIPGYSVTVLANPDVGQATFIVMLEPVKSTPAGAIAGVDVWLQPVNGRLPKAVYPATAQSARHHLEFLATPGIDTAEMLNVGVDIHLADGMNRSFVTQVEATPPGIGPWGLLVFLVPFVLFGALWVIVFVRRSRGAKRSGLPTVHPATVTAAPTVATAISRDQSK